ncbi:MAG: hypothetical protein KC496_03960, partial [Anaerolineae bacterium]|nr:hypothetical protein [Anaerolineae bacterium]
MNESRAIVERVSRINAHYQHVELAVDDPALRAIKPGESLLVHLGDPDEEREQWDPYLREQWWPAGVTNKNLLLIERPLDSRYRPQQVISVLGPVGQPYRFRKSLRNVLLIAYDTEPIPLTCMIRALLNNDISVTLVLLGRALQYDTNHLPELVEVIHGDEIGVSWPEMVMTLGWADQIFVAAAQDDELLHFAEVLRVTKEMRIEVPKNYIFGVFQPTLPCGVGAC